MTCPRFESAFADGVAVCSDCRVPLYAPGPRGQRLRWTDGMVKAGVSDEESVMTALTELLVEAGIDHHVDVERVQGERKRSAVGMDSVGQQAWLSTFTLWIQPDDLERTERLVMLLEGAPSRSPVQLVAVDRGLLSLSDLTRDNTDVPAEAPGTFDVPDLAPPVTPEAAARAAQLGYGVVACLVAAVGAAVVGGLGLWEWWVVSAALVWYAYRVFLKRKRVLNPESAEPTPDEADVSRSR